MNWSQKLFVVHAAAHFQETAFVFLYDQGAITAHAYSSTGRITDW